MTRLNNDQDLIFALDIGTRTIIGLVIEYKDFTYKIIASEVVEHEQRAMLDGQIHNVNEVVRQVQKVKAGLENKLNINLKRVAIAAAGRALKTVVKQYSIDFGTPKNISIEDVEALEFAAVQEAQEELATENSTHGPGDYHFVGYSVIEYHLDNIFLSDLVGQRGSTIQAEIVATFLPRIVIDSLLSVINQVGLEVQHLTLEPIAAAEIVIPEGMHNFNLALVDIGAGTSDIALTKGGSMIGYAMVPVAGDEITEVLTEEFLLDYNSGEKVKRSLNTKDIIKATNILGREVEINSNEAVKIIQPEVEKIAGLITDKIQEINTQSPRAVICIGGGALTPLLVKELGEKLELDEKRIGVRDSKGLKNISGKIEGVNDTQTLTPLGIAISCHQNQKQAVFLNVEVNERPVRLFVLNQPVISDALLAAEIDIKEIKATPGMGLTCTVNGELKTIKGSYGQPGHVILNGEEAELDTPINSNDKIEFVPGQDGEDATAVIADVLPEDIRIYKLIVNGNEVELTPSIYQDHKQVNMDTSVRDGADITYNELDTIRDGITRLLEIPPEQLESEVINFNFNKEKKEITTGNYIIKKDEETVDLDRSLEDGLNLKIIKNENKEITIGSFLELREEEIDITFNGSQLTIPLTPEIKCNGEEVTLDYKIQPGDNIICKSSVLNVNQVLKHINYQLSPKMKKEVELLINGRSARFKDKVDDGDKIIIKFNSG